MKLKELWKQKEVTLSFEVFPPKKDPDFESVKRAVSEICKLRPDFISVTYGAGGGTSVFTSEIAKNVQDQGVTALAHLTCVSSTRERVQEELGRMTKMGIENVLALRGDYPAGFDPDAPRDYRYASQLIRDIRNYNENNGTDFSIGAACYPDGHVESASQSEDILHLRRKVDCGVDWLTTQMFFDNSAMYSFLFRAREAGIEIPVLAGIMPITNAAQLGRMLAMSGTTFPNRFRMMVDRFRDKPEAIKQAGIVYASEQIIDLVANGVRGVHIYTMNKPDVAEGIYNNLSRVLGRL